MSRDAAGPAVTGLAALTAALDAASRTRADYPRLPELKQLRAQWETLHASSRLRIALQQAPAEGGPLNSAVLVHRMLAQMQACSPGYLAHFVAYADTLAWLDHASMPTAATQPGTGRPRAPRKAPAGGRRPR